MKIIFKNERPVSLNMWYSGIHWSKRKQEADRIHALCKYTVKKNLFKKPVDIIITGYFKNKPLDPDNITSKLWIDGLKGRVIVDDTMQYVSSVITRSRIDKNEPRIEIDITEVEEYK